MNRLLLEALHCREVPRRPLWIQRQAGRFLPEYRELRRRHGFARLLADPELAAQVTMLPLERFAFDAAITFADIMSPLSALGVSVRFDPGPILEAPLRSRAQIEALPEPSRLGGGEIAPQVFCAQRLVRAALPPEVALLGFAGAPLTLAAYLVEGTGVRGFPRLRALCYTDEAAFSLLLDKLARLCAAYLIEQHRAGADAVQLFDSWAGLLDQECWRRLVLPPLRSLLLELQRHGVPSILYVNDAAHLLAAYAELPATALAVDWRVDLAGLRRRLPERALQGNLDPAVLLAGPEATRRHAESLLAAVPRLGHIVNLGHGILPDTPLESVAALLTVVHGEAAQPSPSQRAASFA